MDKKGAILIEFFNSLEIISNIKELSYILDNQELFGQIIDFAAALISEDQNEFSNKIFDELSYKLNLKITLLSKSSILYESIQFTQKCPIILNMMRVTGNNLEKFLFLTDNTCGHQCLDPLINRISDSYSAQKRLIVTISKILQKGVSRETKEKISKLLNVWGQNYMSWQIEKDLLSFPIRIVKQESDLKSSQIKPFPSVLNNPSNFSSIPPITQVNPPIHSEDPLLQKPFKGVPVKTSSIKQSQENPPGLSLFPSINDSKVPQVSPPVSSNPSQSSIIPNFQNPSIDSKPSIEQPKKVFHCDECRLEAHNCPISLSCGCQLAYGCVCMSIIEHKCILCSAPILQEKLEELSIYL